MLPEQWAKVKRIFQAALDVEPGQRPAFVERECGSDGDTLKEVRGLLEAQRESGFLDGEGQQVLAQVAANMEAEPAPAASFEGSLLHGRYRIGKQLGEGGFATVYSACDEQLHNRPVVVKVIRALPHRAEWIEKRFKQETQALARVDHPGIVGVLDSGRTPDGLAYLVMQFVQGQTLRNAISPEGMDWRRAANLVAQIGRALAVAHEAGIYHRDLKPENVLIRQLPHGEEQAVIIDFGIATVKADPMGETAATTVVGSAYYMAPEQLRGKPSASSDIYAMGVIAYEMITGQLPYAPDSPFALIEMQKHGPEKSPASLRPDLPPEFDRLILQCLSVEAKDRPADPGEQAARLLAPAQPAQVRPSRRTVWIAIAALPIIAAAVWSWARSGSPPSPDLTYSIEVLKPNETLSKPLLFTGPLAFASKDRIRLRYTAAVPGHLYLLNQPPQQSKLILLYPYRADQGPLTAGATVAIPAEAEHWIEFDQQPGQERIWLVWSPREIGELESARPAALSNGGDFGDRAAAIQKAVEGFERVTGKPDSEKMLLKGTTATWTHLLVLEHR